MIKKITLLVITIILITGCGTTKKYDGEKIVLDNQYYNKGEFIDVKSDYISDNSHKNYVLFVYNMFCSLKIPCENIFQEYMTNNKIDFLSMNIDEYKKTKFYNEVRLAPTVIIVKNNEIVAFLKADSDEDLEKYQDVKEFERWINNYIYISD
jgi:alpha-acetolactate decarboxylase